MILCRNVSRIACFAFPAIVSPQKSCGHGPVGTPSFSKGIEALDVGSGVQLHEIGCGNLQREVASGPGIGMSKA